MNLNHLRVFAAVAETANVTRAASHLCISQPAVSKQLAEFEATLGITLFDRLPRGMRLTGAGEQLAQHARRLLACEAAAETAMEELRGLTAGSLTVGASTTIGSYLVPALFRRYSEAHPHIRLDLEIANTAVIQSAVRDDRLDFGLTEGFVSSDQLDVEVFAHDRMVAIVAPDHPARTGEPLTAKQLCELPLLVREQGSGTRDVIEAALSKKGLHPKPRMALGSTEALKNAVGAGMGVAIVSGLTVEFELATSRLAELPIADLRIERALHLLQLRGKQPSPAASAFLELLVPKIADAGA
ncbi:MAG: DNA-binding transcriptional LysR family regulator [Hyphomicrobiaceae bacterium]|jgi:DNA-binding transcriptional LysR family regulator